MRIAFLPSPALLAATIGAWLLSSCSSFKEVELKGITGAELMRMDGQRISLRVDALVDNPNGFRIAVEEPDVDLYVNDQYIGKALLDSALVLERRSSAIYPVYLHTDLAGGPLLAMVIMGAMQGEMKLAAKGTVAGRSGALRRRFPFELEQVVNLSE
ncbi:MAG: LEA type 2 family protein [Flavobacteriales bacterium]|nr:LEA type 2 family protein [Flavobacteriales bacterium]